MDCVGLQALTDSSEESCLDETCAYQADNDQNNMSIDYSLVNVPKSPSKEEKKETLYGQYKDGLKVLMTGNYESAERIFQSILNHSYLESVDDQVAAKNEENEDQPLIKLKYIIYKNLASINKNNKGPEHLSTALGCLIKAAKLDATDLCLWFDIGSVSLKLERFWIAKLAFEQSLLIDPNHWPSLDSFIVLVYALGDYSLCLKYVFASLKLDKFYVNGIILMKKIQMFEEAFYSQQIEVFVDSNYVSFSLDLNEFLNETPGEYYDELFERIDSIKKTQLKSRLLPVDLRSGDGAKARLVIPREVARSWTGLGKFLLDMSDESGPIRFQMPIELEVEPELVKVVRMSDENEKMEEKKKQVDNLVQCEEEKQCEEIVVALMTAPKNGGNKRKNASSNSEDYWKRRSSRKVIDLEHKETDTELKINDILAKFFDEDYLKDSDKSLGKYFMKKQSTAAEVNLNESLIELNVPELKSDETKEVAFLLQTCLAIPLQHEDINIHKLVRAFLVHLAESYNKTWPIGLDEVYVNLFNLLNSHQDQFEALSNPDFEELSHLQSFTDLCQICLVYLEIEFSKFKALIDKLTQKKELNEHAIELINKKYIHKLVFFYQQLETYYTAFNNSNNPIPDFKVRISCLAIYASLNTVNGTISTDFYVRQVLEELGDEYGRVVLVPNSRIFPVVSRPRVLEFLKLNKKKQILKQNSEIEKMFESQEYEEIVRQTEEFAENYKLSLKDANFEPSIYIYLLKSLFNLDYLEKSAYFSLKFLAQIILHFKAQLTALNKPPASQEQPQSIDETTSSSLLSSNNSNSSSSTLGNIKSTTANHAHIFTLLTQTLDTLLATIIARKEHISQKTSNNTLSSSSQLQQLFNEDSFQVSDVLNLMQSLIQIFIQEHETAQKLFPDTYRPIKAFFILHECMTASSKLQRVQFISLSHSYLAKFGFCGDNQGQFLFWSAQTLMDYLQTCNICNNNNNSSNSDTCNSCDESGVLLEQIFNCLFGYKKPKRSGSGYLENHSVVRVPYTLDNCRLMYEFFRPDGIPEFDDMVKFSITSEFNEFLKEVLELFHHKLESFEADLDLLSDRFFNCLETEDFDGIEDELTRLKVVGGEAEQSFADIYYLVGDYYHKTEKDFEKKKAKMTRYLIKDITLNMDRFDAWSALALCQSETVVSEYLESGVNLIEREQLVKFLRNVRIGINLFRKAIELIELDKKILIEYGSFMYQIHAFCSRQLKLDRHVSLFNADHRHFITNQLEEKKLEFLNFAIEAYETLNNSSSGTTDTEETGEASRQSQQVDQTSKSSASKDEEEDDSEKWLCEYMLGKVKEKLNSGCLQSLEHYLRAARNLERHKAVYLKKISYKTKGNLSLESNEVFYRIYALVLKRLHFLESNVDELISVVTFLEAVKDMKFVTIHVDFQLDDISAFLAALFQEQSIKLSESGFRCACICVAGLMQILRRFNQHYRSAYRLAAFYARFMDGRLACYNYAKNILLGCPDWATKIIYMSSPGLFFERNKTNFFNGVYQIKEQDLERGGSYMNHLFETVKLLVEIIEKTNDFGNMIELARGLFQKPADADRKYLEESQRIYMANVSLETAFNILMDNAVRNLHQQVSCVDSANAEMEAIELLPLLLDAYEVYKLSSKYYESMNNRVEILMKEVYLRVIFNGNERRGPVGVEEMIRFCRAKETKNFGNSNGKAKALGGSRPRSRSSVNQPVSQIPTNLNMSLCGVSTSKQANSSINGANDVILLNNKN